MKMKCKTEKMKRQKVSQSYQRSFLYIRYRFGKGEKVKFNSFQLRSRRRFRFLSPSIVQSSDCAATKKIIQLKSNYGFFGA